MLRGRRLVNSRSYVPTMPKTAVKMSSMKMLEKEVRAGEQPLMSAAAAGLGHVGFVTKAGAVLLK